MAIERSGTGVDDAAQRAARERVAALFRQLNALTPDELGRIGLLRPTEDRGPLVAAVDAAASATGRRDLVAEARHQAADLVMRRYADGTFRPTWVALNWGLSGGSVEDRVAVVEAVADAVAVAAVSDVLDPEIADALAADAQHVLGLAGGSASDGALVRGLRQPTDPALRRSPGRQRIVLLVTAFIAVLVSLAGAAAGAIQGVIGSLAAIIIATGFVYVLLAKTNNKA